MSINNATVSKEARNFDLLLITTDAKFDQLKDNYKKIPPCTS